MSEPFDNGQNDHLFPLNSQELPYLLGDDGMFSEDPALGPRRANSLELTLTFTLDHEAFLQDISSLDKPMFKPLRDRVAEKNWKVYQKWKKETPSNDDAKAFIQHQHSMEQKIWPKYLLHTLNLL